MSHKPVLIIEFECIWKPNCFHKMSADSRPIKCLVRAITDAKASPENIWFSYLTKMSRSLS